MSGQGKRERKFFEIERDAREYSKKLRGQYDRGQRGSIVDAGLARMAAEAAKLVPSGASILEWIKTFAEMTAMLTPYGITPMDACRAAVAQHQASGTAESFRERYDRFVRDNETRWRDRYAKDMAKLPRWVGEEFMVTACAAINPAVIESALRANGADAATTVLARKTRVLAVLHAAAKRPKRGPVKIMTVTQCAAMLRACRDRSEVQAVALLLFGGVRPDAVDGELSKLDWRDVDGEHVTIHPETSKTDSDRFIPITPRLARLLRGHPVDGPVLPAGWAKRIQAIRKAAGISGDQDITRHTFASNFLVAFGEDAAKSAMGHTAGSQTIFRHYRRAVKPDAAKKYFR
ncbi:MAG: hypothetical protein NTW21_16560 [Verrucomicrobia bacterium]|nr:hypothetical protein [Verrucomicrobiota bacterium]